MKVVLFTQVLFENSKILILFCILTILTLTFLGVRVISLSNDLAENDMPDIIIKGKMDEDGMLRYKYYNDMPNVSDYLRTNLMDDEIEIYGITSRSMETKRDPLTNTFIEYTIYGVSNNFIEEKLARNIRDGRLPEVAQLEAVMGIYAKNRYGATLGDTIQHPITLNQEWGNTDINNYTLSGVLSEQVQFFKGAIFVSQETYESLYADKEENLIYIYVKNEDQYNEALNAVIQLNIESSVIGDIIMNFHYKEMVRRTTFFSCLLVGVISFILVLLMIAYLMKGLTRKIGILKALGVSNRYIFTIFIGGLGVMWGISFLISVGLTYSISLLLNMNLSNFLGYSVQEYRINTYSILVGLSFILICFAASYIVIYRYNKKISPKEALAKE